MAGGRYSIIPSDAVFDERLSRFDLHVLAALGAHSNNNGWCTIKQATLANKINSTPGSVQNSVRRLVMLGYVRRRYRHAENGAQLASLYQVVMDREPVDPEMDVGIALEDSVELATPMPAEKAEGAPLASGGEGHSPMGGRATTQWPHKNDLFLERPPSVEDRPRTPRDELRAVLDETRTEAVIEHRKRLRKPLTVRAAHLLAKRFGECSDPNTAADAMVLNGWAGFDRSWIERDRPRGVTVASPKPRSVVDAARARLLELEAGDHDAG